eukprot:gnl/Hemi2/8022_TR2763_c0_g1_i1.p1 gnl/Hemi2/8022_TR2763_c0_g1~~gnl/Hemi2/8022_TR2763_c0_g1_i1.p1  ORF type:complete len:141 (-),score=8.35 gnl/Hemi2/8022_TR2763_c0_g1_i1:125-547(-)
MHTDGGFAMWAAFRFRRLADLCIANRRMNLRHDQTNAESSDQHFQQHPVLEVDPSKVMVMGHDIVRMKISGLPSRCKPARVADMLNNIGINPLHVAPAYSINNFAESCAFWVRGDTDKIKATSLHKKISVNGRPLSIFVY